MMETDTIECLTGAHVPTGVVSEGTLRPSDLLSCTLRLYENVNPGGFVAYTVERAVELMPFADWKYRKLTGKWHPCFDLTDDQWQDVIDCVVELTDLINHELPDTHYFGPHEGDGACLGIWKADA